MYIVVVYTHQAAGTASRERITRRGRPEYVIRIGTLPRGRRGPFGHGADALFPWSGRVAPHTGVVMTSPTARFGITTKRHLRPCTSTRSHRYTRVTRPTRIIQKTRARAARRCRGVGRRYVIACERGRGRCLFRATRSARGSAPSKTIRFVNAVLGTHTGCLTLRFNAVRYDA